MSFTFGFDLPLSRRRMMVGASTLAAALPAAAAAAPSETWHPDFDRPQDNLDAYMKLAYSTSSSEVVRSWFGGHVFSLVEGQPLRPLMKLDGFGVGSVQKQPDGSYKTAWKEIAFYKDLATDKILDTWTNPLGDKTEVMHIQNRNVSSVITTSFKQLSGGPPGMDQSNIQRANYRRPDDPTQPFLLPVWQVGDAIMMWMDVSAVLPNPLNPEEWPRESSGPMIRIAEYTQHVGNVRQMFDAKRSSADYTGAWNRFSPWLPWMEMGGQPGGLFLRSSIRRLHSFDELPRDILAHTEKNFPTFLDPKVDTTLKNESSWEVFKKNRKPLPRRT